MPQYDEKKKNSRKGEKKTCRIKHGFPLINTYSLALIGVCIFFFFFLQMTAGKRATWFQRRAKPLGFKTTAREANGEAIFRSFFSSFSSCLPRAPPPVQEGEETGAGGGLSSEEAHLSGSRWPHYESKPLFNTAPLCLHYGPPPAEVSLASNSSLDSRFEEKGGNKTELQQLRQKSKPVVQFSFRTI